MHKPLQNRPTALGLDRNCRKFRLATPSIAAVGYVLAPLGLRALFRAVRVPSRLALADALIALAIAWCTIDGIYVAYHSAVGNTMYRVENAWASTPLYFLAGFAWLYRGSLRQLLDEIAATVRLV